MQLNFGRSKAAQPWPITFVGGTADLAEASIAPPQNPASCHALPLAMVDVGDRVWVVQLKGGHSLVRRLTDLGIVTGSEITIVSRTASGSVIVALQGCRIGLGAGMAHRVMVTTVQQEVSQTAPIQESTQFEQGGNDMTTATLHLGALEVGQSGRIVSYEDAGRAYRGKLLAMGLTPGTQFTVTRQAPMGDPIEVEVRGFKLSLRKGEAAALKVETLTDQEVHHD